MVWGWAGGRHSGGGGPLRPCSKSARRRDRWISLQPRSQPGGRAAARFAQSGPLGPPEAGAGVRPGLWARSTAPLPLSSVLHGSLLTRPKPKTSCSPLWGAGPWVEPPIFLLPATPSPAHSRHPIDAQRLPGTPTVLCVVGRWGWTLRSQDSWRKCFHQEWGRVCRLGTRGGGDTPS